ncbi:SDR family oxidoreductase [Rhodococcoides yunnanense]|uniref:SDR family oxidoreductase n=1 Tax=Rhodococcoides yunnanense TaxID=278209 RepID=A0ABU4B7S9_9NOCA|nr:SDR family oxidoreductase [Rhodococcus yunnanensis]MDV6260256.1 SDR family oxidoreductase [Rhodococcus yunnanensis]
MHYGRPLLPRRCPPDQVVSHLRFSFRTIIVTSESEAWALANDGVGMTVDTVERIALVTGASRGIGAEVALQLASAGYLVVVNYREKRARAEKVVSEIESAGGKALALQADLADAESVEAMVALLADRFGHLDLVVLNASGGLELGAGPDYAMQLNRDAQLRLAELVRPFMRPSSRIVFVTSHQAHFVGQKPVPVDYEPIALSKRAGEDALRALIPELQQQQIDLAVVSGDMIDGTIIVRLLERRNPDAVAARRDHGVLPTIEDFAQVVVRASTTAIESGQTFYVGGADYLQHS